MKTRLILLLLLIPLGLGIAQNGPGSGKGHGRGHAPVTGSTSTQSPGKGALDSTAAGQATPGEAGQGQGFVDENGDGINDRCATSQGQNGQGKGRKGMRKSDTFVDTDGDGINDNRCNGLGPRMRRRQGNSGK